MEINYTKYETEVIKKLVQKVSLLIRDNGKKTTISLLQRKLGIGYDKASKVVECLSDNDKFAVDQSPLKELFGIAIKYKAFEKLTNLEWAELLPKYEEEANRLNVWENFDGETWVKLLIKNCDYKKLADKFNAWQKFDENDWVRLLKNDESFADIADKFNAWKLLKSWDWSCLLVGNPAFENKAKSHNAFASFDSTDWKYLMCVHPKFVELAEEIAQKEIQKEERLAKEQNRQPQQNSLWDKISGYAWSSLLACQKDFLLPIVIRHNVFCKFNGEDWSLLLSQEFESFKEYADKYSAWQKFDNKDWCKLLQK